MQIMGWLDVAKVLGILHHRGIQLILASSWARPAKLVKGKGRGGMFLFLLFLHFHFVPLSSLSLSFISSTISFISFLPFSWRRHKMTHDMLNPNTISQSCKLSPKTICLKCQLLFSGKIRQMSSVCHLLN